MWNRRIKDVLGPDRENQDDQAAPDVHSVHPSPGNEIIKHASKYEGTLVEVVMQVHLEKLAQDGKSRADCDRGQKHQPFVSLRIGATDKKSCGRENREIDRVDVDND